ncbi:MAG: T9SS type A sorting domain-containing protein [Prevotellaceae bacterium]|jgi:hypothetical protein|nr:T9SS type A sorting domain-containing protein [Prevotellaceae bacterium]
MKYLNFFCLIITLLLYSQAVFARWQGAGTAQSPYKIYTLADLEAISANEGSFHYYENIHFELMNDVNDSLRMPLCSGFKGYFHGKGHCITLAMNNVDNSNNCVINTLHGTIDSLVINGKVANFISLFVIISIEGKLLDVVCNVEIKPHYMFYNNTYGTYCSVWVIGNYGIIENCINNSDLRNEYAGHTAFSVFGESNTGHIINCINNGNITIEASPQDYTYCYIFSGENLNNGSIINCTNNGNINIVGVPYLSSISVFAHINSSTILNCINNGNINAKKTDYIGTFAGIHCGGEVKNCINRGNITGEVVAGGIVGICGCCSIIENCLNTSYIFGNSETGGIVGKFDFAGNTQQTIVKNNLNISKTRGYALLGDTDQTIYANPYLTLENNFYDKQMATIPATCDGDIAGKAESKLTTEITGFALQSILGDGWSYAEDRYPIPLGLENESSALLAATPVYLHYTDENNYNSIDSVSENFTVGLENNVQWQAFDNKVFLCEEDGILQDTGYETLNAMLDNYQKKIQLYIRSIPAVSFYTISGNVSINDNPLANTRIDYLSNSTFTDASGNYSFDVPENADVTIVPILFGYIFSPENIILQNITQNHINQNFAANLNSSIAANSFNELSICPNPVKDQLIIDSELLTINNVEICDIAGKALSTHSTNTINMSNLAQGVYLVKIKTNKGVVTEKVIKN